MKKIFILSVIILGTIAYYGGAQTQPDLFNKALNHLCSYNLPAPVDSFLAEKFLPQNFWLHRTNSAAKLDQFIDKYHGFEMDIIYYPANHAFENSHDNVSLEKYSLEKQFIYFKQHNITTPDLWLDFKNLTTANAQLSLNDLDALLKDYQINKKNIWIESSNFQSLALFKKAGYKTSYYFPYYDFKNMSNTEITHIKELTEQIATSPGINAISFDGIYYDFIETLTLPPNISLLTWLHTKNWRQVFWSPENKKFLLDERIKIILVKDRSRFNR